MSPPDADHVSFDQSRKRLFDHSTSNALYKCSVFALLVLGAIRLAGAAPGPFAGDGWYTWRVDAINNAPTWCCMTWSRGQLTGDACHLDQRNFGFGERDGGVESSGEMQIYVKVTDGKAQRIRSLSPQCPIDSPTDITDFGVVDNDESLAWLGEYVGSDARTAEDALTAIATHGGSRAGRMLVDAADSSASRETRKDAIFWMAKLRIAETNRDVERFMFEDDSADIRKHAAFALAESDSPDRVTALTRQGKEDENRDVRSQAWFWLAQTKLPGVEVVIDRAISEDRSRHVREQAVFALSQLPDERAIASLLGILRNKDRPQHIREQALFWLVESDSDAAYEEIEKLLAARE